MNNNLSSATNTSYVFSGRGLGLFAKKDDEVIEARRECVKSRIDNLSQKNTTKRRSGRKSNKKESL